MWTSTFPIVLAVIAVTNSVQVDQIENILFKSDTIVVPYKSTKHGEFLSFDLSENVPLLYITIKIYDIKYTMDLVRIENREMFSVKTSNNRSTTYDIGNGYYAGNINGIFSTVEVKVNYGMQGVIKVRDHACIIEYVTNDEDQCRQNGCPHVLYCHANNNGVNPVDGARPSTSDPVEKSVQRARNRRSLKGPVRYIETLLVGEFSMSEFYQDTVTEYLESLIFKVNEILQDETIGINIQIIITKIVLWSEQESANKIVKTSLQLSRSRVCSWARMNQDIDDASEDHYDLALFLTRKELSKSGYEQNGQMCSEFRSCALVQDEGFTTSFAIAQEIGHLLGLKHDDDNGCADDIFRGSIMSKVIRSTFIRYLWSNCSRETMQKDIKSFRCLRDYPLSIPYPQPNRNIGEKFSLDEQCQYIYGGNYTACPWVTIENRADPCNILLCYNPDESRNCIPEKRRSPPLDGTQCAPNMWCLGGRCLAYKKRNGAWGPWSAWGPCTKSCGIGVSKKTRRCDNPPPLKGGRRCRGKSKDFRFCNADDCVRPTEDFRELQCRRRSNDVDNLWVPYVTGNEVAKEQCQLSCTSLLTGSINKTRQNVIDGTRCNYDDTNSVCVNGNCLLVGCNGIRGSKRVHDVCGVCDGDGSSCHQKQGQFDGIIVPYGTESVVIIPRRAREIVISKPRNLYVIFVIEDIVSNHYVFESSNKNETTGFAVWAGTRFAYELGREREFIAAKGPLLKPIRVIVSSTVGYSRFVEVRYQYVIPNEPDLTTPIPTTTIATTIPSTTQKTTVAIPLYRWESYGWTVCTKTCGGGWRYFQQECRNTKTRDRENDSKCDFKIFTPMSIRKPCNEEECPSPRYLWETTGWQRCSKRCGAGGIQTRSVQCVRLYNGTQTSVRSSRCQGMSPPPVSKTCNQRPCPAYWKTGKWSQCSVTCGLGVKMRSVKCSKPSNADSEYVCYDSKPKTIKQCLKPSCDEGCRVVNNPMCGPSLYETYCTLRGYRKFCCRSCEEMEFIFSKSQKKGRKKK
ncbi:A disintegrin and metalloproteinase with thrombospondin motifs 3-like [Antedon mediterranea]|uniref:A disintegrin and metalloproteinase with thrombospondin motifs 3-like n=1 Tax=Antedon mediterranea TaxID=105859 RepID=UPI003AF6C284